MSVWRSLFDAIATIAGGGSHVSGRSRVLERLYKGSDSGPTDWISVSGSKDHSSIVIVDMPSDSDQFPEGMVETGKQTPYTLLNLPPQSAGSCGVCMIQNPTGTDNLFKVQIERLVSVPFNAFYKARAISFMSAGGQNNGCLEGDQVGHRD
ncbi:hypothetical protein PSPO01_08567 [Paraphaeosphaeria sporulosa]